jgi:hypothetical protein
MIPCASCPLPLYADLFHLRLFWGYTAAHPGTLAAIIDLARLILIASPFFHVPPPFHAKKNSCNIYLISFEVADLVLYSMGFVDLTTEEQNEKVQDFDKNSLDGSFMYKRKKHIETFRLRVKT